MRRRGVKEIPMDIEKMSDSELAAEILTCYPDRGHSADIRERHEEAVSEAARRLTAAAERVREVEEETKMIQEDKALLHLYVRAITERAERAEAVLKLVEWSAYETDEDGSRFSVCPCCSNPEDNGHIPGCKLRAALSPAPAVGEGDEQVNPNEMSLDQCLRWMERDIVLHGDFPYAMPISTTLDVIAVCMPEGWMWTRTYNPEAEYRLEWRGQHLKFGIVVVVDTGDEKLDRARLAVACRMAGKEKP